ncbi:MAG: bifunctional methylenetetrahydrofolate dehydrogenase/methenyltetrahydrofolate cyclohydrolase FolD [Candidatus Hydrothermota bacterium]|nr:MAG: bifunctional methylenetetrahydrofolate dehydrogenase/methenyltetrahydrofolate cyclohydrolase FolD [Candidatus Hydrothermae bacterium]
MSATIIDGRAVANKVHEEVRYEVERLNSFGIEPFLAVILVGENPASKVYVRNKEKACGKVGIKTKTFKLPSDTTYEQLKNLILELNNDEKVHGILVQLPLPSHLPEKEILELVDPQKDVDGFHPYNLGRLLSGHPTVKPCTPLGIMRLLDEYDVDLKGKEAVIVGRSVIVGKPMWLLLLERHATVTTCHSRTADLSFHTRRADVLVVAAGRAKLIKGDMVKPGAVVIDVGINRTEEGKLVGDVDFDEVKEVASMITPVPGGVGPMTVAMLLYNTVEAAKRKAGILT